ncbi:MAG TPA: hypothetical protein PK421_02620 [Chitinophagaceae bacterium]|jgi:hypothetical protein|nr:hypothetical protein [Chitinophagaceae bacterium]
MKKYFLVAFVLFACASANAQSEKNTAKQTGENPADPLVNGIPYSQYKAQQLALQNKKATTINIPAGVGMSNVKGNAQPNKVTPAQQVNEVNPNGPSSIREEENKQNAAKQAELLKANEKPKAQPVNKLPVPDFSNPASLSSVTGAIPATNGAIPVAGKDGKTVAPNSVNGQVVPAGAMEKPAVKAVEKSNTNGPKSTDAVPAKAETTKQ